jgi:hypothetical protein
MNSQDDNRFPAEKDSFFGEHLLIQFFQIIEMLTCLETGNEIKFLLVQDVSNC